MKYNDTIDENEQIDTEESIAFTLFDTYGLNEEDAGEAAREVLLLALKTFRPDLLQTELDGYR